MATKSQPVARGPSSRYQSWKNSTLRTQYNTWQCVKELLKDPEIFFPLSLQFLMTLQRRKFYQHYQHSQKLQERIYLYHTFRE